MTSLTTAKLLLFIALFLGPKYGDNNHTIEIVSRTSYSVWTQNSDGWSLTQVGTPNDAWPTTGTNISTADLNQFGRENAEMVRAIKAHDWKGSDDSKLYFPNGDVVEKQGTKAFYTINAGASNQQIFTIMTMENGRPL